MNQNQESLSGQIADPLDEQIAAAEKIEWYRSSIDKATMRLLNERNNWLGFRQIALQVLLSLITGGAAYIAWERHSWFVMIVAIYAYGTIYSFLAGGVSVHELSHRMVFKTRFWNDFFLAITAFLGWVNFVHFRASHVKHHQVTVYTGLDHEVILPQKLRWWHWVYALTINVPAMFTTVTNLVWQSLGIRRSEWERRIIPDSNPTLHRQWSNCARCILLGHTVLAAVFIYFHLWVLLVLVTAGPFIGGWLVLLVGFPQHAGLPSNVPDFRLCCRTMTLHPFPAFLYWQMNYHIEHHMFPAVPFYNLPKLHQVMLADLPPTPHGLWATWKQMLPVLRRQRTDPNYFFVALLPSEKHNGSSPL